MHITNLGASFYTTQQNRGIEGVGYTQDIGLKSKDNNADKAAKISTTQTGISIHSPNIHAFDMSKLQMIHISETDEKTYKSFINAQERMLESLHTHEFSTSENRAYEPYATVEFNGKVLARIDNNGFTETSNVLGGTIHKLLANEGNGLKGPALAQERAAKIAEALGGQIVKYSTTLTQAQFNAIPEVRPTVDYQVMKDDPIYEQLQKTKQARTFFFMQQMGEELAVEKSSTQKSTFDTSKGTTSLSIDEYFSSKSAPFDLDEIPLLMPTAENIDKLSKHASEKLQEFLKANGIPEGPKKISYDDAGKIKLPHDYLHADEFKQALVDDPAMGRELQTIAALTSHYVGMKAAMQGNGRGQLYTEIALNFGADGLINVTANDEPYI